MSQREAAAHLGITVGSLARYEAGERRTPMVVLRRMAGAYQRPVAELLEHGGCTILPLPRGPRWRPRDVPAAITALRLAAGLTKVDLGRLTGRSGQAVGAWEAGRTRPGTATSRRLETIFGLPGGQLPY
jgi:transcriptional regulator with XRE-family HTH domain